ncbi:hypothetical protein ACNQ2O_01405 [Mycoplasma sp. AA7A]|uniref:hypothetical protein n=1 Tax=Mycoplasma sp. AA7A TaxID=3401665 RepID=UPI003AB0ED98
MAKVNFKDKKDIAVPANVNEVNLIRAQDINELKNSINTNYDEFTSFKSTTDSLTNTHDEKLKTLESSINQNKSDISQLKEKPAGGSIKPLSTVKKSGNCPAYNSELNLWYLTNGGSDTILGINIIINFTNGNSRTFSFVPDSLTTKYGFNVIANGDGGEPRAYYFEVRPNGSSGYASRWRDLYVKYAGYHTLYNATWSTSNNGIKNIEAVCVYIPA